MLPLFVLGLFAQAAAPTQAELQKTYDMVLGLLQNERAEAEQMVALMEKYAPRDPITLEARKRYEAAQRTRSGQPAPPFQLPSLEEPQVEVSLETFKGKTVLLEFWATWCPYCVEELPGVERAWERYKDRNFEILSLSMDRKPSDVAPFRKAKFAMPWKHAFLPGAKLNPMTIAYGAVGIPHYVLVGPDGRILAAGASLRGDKLEPTLAKHLGKVRNDANSLP